MVSTTCGQRWLVMIKLFQSFLILTQWLSAIGLVVLILLLLPLSVPRRTRLFASQAMYIVSYLWGVALWMIATAILLNAWGVVGFVIGVLLVGFGSVPLACVACVITGDWLNLGALVLGVLLVFGLRAIALRLLKSVAAQSPGMNPLNRLLSVFKKKPTSPTEADKRWLQGYQAFKAGKKSFAEKRDQEALEYFDIAIECGIQDAEVYGLRGSCLQTLEWNLDAIDDFSRAIALEPEDCNNYYQRAMSKTATGDANGFLADIQEAIRLSKVVSALNHTYNLGAKDMGWKSTAAMYEGQAALSADWPDFIIDKNIERTKLRGRRGTTTNARNV